MRHIQICESAILDGVRLVVEGGQSVISIQILNIYSSAGNRQERQGWWRYGGDCLLKSLSEITLGAEQFHPQNAQCAVQRVPKEAWQC